MGIESKQKEREQYATYEVLDYSSRFSIIAQRVSNCCAYALKSKTVEKLTCVGEVKVQK